MINPWAVHGDCRFTPDVWFEVTTYKYAVEACEGCPVLQQCKEWSTTTECDPRYGVVGGLRPVARMRAQGIKSSAHAWEYKPIERGEKNGCN